MASATERSFPSLETVRPSLAYLDDNAERVLLILLYVYIMLVITVEVFRRFVLNISSLWGLESALYMFIYLTWIGASWAVAERQHIRIDIIYSYVSERTKGILYIVGDLAMIAFALLIIQISLPLILSTLEFGTTTDALDLNLAFFQAAVPIGMALFLIRTLQVLYEDVVTVYNGEPVREGGTLFGDSE